MVSVDDLLEVTESGIRIDAGRKRFDEYALKASTNHG
jgi:hypothetical protein